MVRRRESAGRGQSTRQTGLEGTLEFSTASYDNPSQFEHSVGDQDQGQPEQANIAGKTTVKIQNPTRWATPFVRCCIASKPVLVMLLEEFPYLYGAW